MIATSPRGPQPDIAVYFSVTPQDLAQYVICYRGSDGNEYIVMITDDPELRYSDDNRLRPVYPLLAGIVGRLMIEDETQLFSDDEMLAFMQHTDLPFVISRDEEGRLCFTVMISDSLEGDEDLCLRRREGHWEIAVGTEAIDDSRYTVLPDDQLLTFRTYFRGQWNG